MKIKDLGIKPIAANTKIPTEDGATTAGALWTEFANAPIVSLSSANYVLCTTSTGEIVRVATWEFSGVCFTPINPIDPLPTSNDFRMVV
jgi:hypothetical protein